MARGPVETQAPSLLGDGRWCGAEPSCQAPGHSAALSGGLRLLRAAVGSTPSPRWGHQGWQTFQLAAGDLDCLDVAEGHVSLPRALDAMTPITQSGQNSVSWPQALLRPQSLGVSGHKHLTPQWLLLPISPSPIPLYLSLVP